MIALFPVPDPDPDSNTRIYSHVLQSLCVHNCMLPARITLLVYNDSCAARGKCSMNTFQFQNEIAVSELHVHTCIYMYVHMYNNMHYTCMFLQH